MKSQNLLDWKRPPRFIKPSFWPISTLSARPEHWEPSPGMPLPHSNLLQLRTQGINLNIFYFLPVSPQSACCPAVPDPHQLLIIPQFLSHMILAINIPALLVTLFTLLFFSKGHCSPQDNENVTRSTNFPSSLFLGFCLPSVLSPHHLQLKIYLFVISRVFSEVFTPSLRSFPQLSGCSILLLAVTPTHSPLIFSSKIDIMDQVVSFVPWKIISFFSTHFKKWQDTAFDVLWLMKIPQEWAANRGAWSSLWLVNASGFLPSSLPQIYNTFRVRGTAGLVNPVMQKCWKMTKLSPFRWVMLTSGFLAVLGEVWSYIRNIHQFRGFAAFCYQGLSNKNTKCCCTPYNRQE